VGCNTENPAPALDGSGWKSVDWSTFLEGREVDLRRARVSIALVSVVLLGDLGCTSGPEKGAPAEETRETLSAEVTMSAKEAEERPKPIASGFANPAQGCALILSSDEFRATPNPDVLAECREDYGVTLENASERVEQGVDEAIQKPEVLFGKGE
jgi:hypothetical protein